MNETNDRTEEAYQILDRLFMASMGYGCGCLMLSTGLCNGCIANLHQAQMEAAKFLGYMTPKEKPDDRRSPCRD